MSLYFDKSFITCLYDLEAHQQQKIQESHLKIHLYKWDYKWKKSTLQNGIQGVTL